MNKVSVVVLTYNQEDFIEKNLRSIFSQKVDFPIELILSNDNSKDNTHKVIKEVLKDTPNHIIVNYTNHKNNLGATPNFYDALKKITGDYIAFCEGDDFWIDENKLQFQYDFLYNNKDYSMCFHQVMNISPYEEINKTLFSKVEDRDYTAFEIYSHWIAHTTSIMLRTDVLDNRVVKEMYNHPDLLYFDTILYMSSSINGKIRGFSKTMSAYLRHDIGISFGVNHKRDIKHNKLDQLIGNLFGGKINEYSEWLIFNRSRIAFSNSLKEGDLSLLYKHLYWILKRRKNLKIYMKRKFI